MRENKLLIQACSGRKQATRLPLAAFELYDGVAFRVVKKFLRENPDRTGNLKILILSAEYGLISPEKRILPYDRRMTRDRSEFLRDRIQGQWKDFNLADGDFEQAFINVGRDYMRALGSVDLKTFRNLQFARGGIGLRNGQLKSWLHG